MAPRTLAIAANKPLDEVTRVLAEADREPAFVEASRRLSQLGWLGTFRAAREFYALTRLVRPKVVVETGVGSGFSSLHILLAMHRNEFGHLYSIDLPNNDPTFRLPESEQAGFLVPEWLKGRWKLILGDTRSELPHLLEQVAPVDVFLHDSLHTYDVMLFESRTVYPFLRPGGLLFCDDSVMNHAFLDFCKQLGTRPSFLYNHGIGWPTAYVAKPLSRGSNKT